MRVITGIARGKRLKSLSGNDVRPTTDKVKEGIFSAIQFDIEGRRFLDMFAGSGQMGIEALSRGAESALVVDNSKKAVEIIKENIAACGFQKEISVRKGDYSEVLTKGAEYDVIFLDPPYASELLAKAIELIVKFDILSKDGIIVCETERDKRLIELDAPYSKGREYLYGKSKITIYRKG